MKKRKVIISLLLITFIIGGVFYIKRMIDYDKKVTVLTEKMLEWQNSAFAISNLTAEFLPYSRVDEPVLQVYLYAYKNDTGNNVSLEDVEKFMENNESSSGKVKTYLEDENIAAYVEWFHGKFDYVSWYGDNLQKELFKYSDDNPKYKKDFNSLNLEEIRELEKKYKNPEYVLDLSKYGNE